MDSATTNNNDPRTNDPDSNASEPDRTDTLMAELKKALDHKPIEQIDLRDDSGLTEYIELQKVNSETGGDENDGSEPTLQSVLSAISAMNERVTSLEQQIRSMPHYGDILQMKVHLAKVAAELTRTTVELTSPAGATSTDDKNKNREDASNNRSNNRSNNS